MLYNLLWRGELPVTPFHMPEALRRKQHGKARISKRMNGESIDLRPAEVAKNSVWALGIRHCTRAKGKGRACRFYNY